jgi:hypothetical protein
MDFKQLSVDEAQIKVADDGSMRFSGYASVFGGLDAHGDRIEKGAYKGTLRGRDRRIKMRWNHFGPVIGKWVTVKEDEYGLYVEGELTPGHSVAEDVYASIKHGAVDGMSIGFRVKDYAMDGNVRVLKKIDLVEISVVEEPADLGARVGQVKNLGELIDEVDSLKEAESLLREAAGLSRAAATAFVSRVKGLCDTDERRDENVLSEFHKMLRGRIK